MYTLAAGSRTSLHGCYIYDTATCPALTCKTSSPTGQYHQAWWAYCKTLPVRRMSTKDHQTAAGTPFFLRSCCFSSLEVLAFCGENTYTL